MADVRIEETEHGAQVFFRGRRLYGNRPRPDAVRRANNLSISDQTIVVLPSPLLGHGLAELLERLPNGSLLFAVELEPDLLRLSQTALKPYLDQRVRLCGPTIADVQAEIDAVLPGGYRRVTEVSVSGGGLLHRTEYRRIRDALESRLRTEWRNRITVAGMGRRWVSNIFANLIRSAEAASASHLSSTAPLIVCGAGPSLEAALPVIRAIRSHVGVVAVDTALPVLLSHGVAPDVVVSVDAQYTNVLDFIPCDRTRYWLAADLCSAPAVLSQHTVHQLAVFTTEFAPLPLIKRLHAAGISGAVVPPRGSVGVTAVELSLAITDSQIYLAGHDLAYTRGRTHARDAYVDHYYATHTRRLRPQFPANRIWLHTIAVTGKDGKTVSDLRLTGYAEQLRHLGRHSGRVRDLCHEGHALGVPVLSSADAVATLRSAGRTGGAVVRVTRSGDPANRRLQAVEFLNQEATMLQQLSRSLKPHLQMELAPTETTRALLSQCSYVTIGLRGAPEEQTPLSVAEARNALINAHSILDRIDRVTLRRS